MKRFFVLALILLMMLAFAACVSDRYDPTPPFVIYCSACQRLTNWYMGEYYFQCSRSGTIWKAALEVRP
jgi:hypothetical protein